LSKSGKNPTHFEFFRIPAEKFDEIFKQLQDAFRHPDKPENREFIDMHRYDPNAQQQTQSQQQTAPQQSQTSQEAPQSQETSQSQPSLQNNAIDESRIDRSQFERIGITRESLEKTGDLTRLLNYQKTDLLPVALKFDDVALRTDARLCLRETADGKLNLSIHAIRKEPELERPYFGVKFTDGDKQNLKNTGNLGRIVEAEYQKGGKTPVFLSIDRQTNELVAVRTERVKIPDNIKGVNLNEQQKKDLSEGKAIYLENMISKKDTPFNAFIQYNADKRSFEFRFDNDRKREQAQKTESSQKQESNLREAPKTFRKKELTDDQRSSLHEGKTVYVSGLEDKQGKKYSGYITLNKESGKPGFMFPPQYKAAVAAGQVTPDDRHKTQVAVNSEGKTSEATIALKEPLKQGQTKPTEKQAEKQVEKQTAMQKPEKAKRGRKIN
jgi:hypothetical protein